jgi:hypothetical protein
LRDLQREWLAAGRTFSEAEVWYVLHCLAAAKARLEQLGIAGFPNCLETVFLNPGWQVSIYPHLACNQPG